jgi:selenocysteine lyase/cysteine desulfurase
MHELAARRSATVARLDIPEPATHDSIIETYRKALDAHPKTRLLLLTHCNNKTGLLLPVRDIVALARPRGVDVVVDAAHSFGQVPLTVKDMDAEFVGLNLHKWVGAPLGVGAMYVREDKIGSLDAVGESRGAAGTGDRYPAAYRHRQLRHRHDRAGCA